MSTAFLLAAAWAASFRSCSPRTVEDGRGLVMGISAADSVVALDGVIDGRIQRTTGRTRALIGDQGARFARELRGALARGLPAGWIAWLRGLSTKA